MRSRSLQGWRATRRATVMAEEDLGTLREVDFATLSDISAASPATQRYAADEETITTTENSLAARLYYLPGWAPPCTRSEQTIKTFKPEHRERVLVGINALETGFLRPYIACYVKLGMYLPPAFQSNLNISSGTPPQGRSRQMTQFISTVDPLASGLWRLTTDLVAQSWARPWIRCA